MARKWWVLIFVLINLSCVFCEDNNKDDVHPSPILGQNEHHLLKEKKFYVELKESFTDFLILQLIGAPSSTLITAQVLNSSQKESKLVNIVEDNNLIFFVPKDVIKQKCIGAGDPCYVEFTLQKLGSTDIATIQAIVMTSKKEADINLSDQLPVSFPFSNDLEFNIKYVPQKDTLEKAISRGVDIHIQNKFAPVIITATITGNPKIKDGNNKKTYITGDMWTNIIHIPAKDIALFNDPVIKVELECEKGQSYSTKIEDVKNTNYFWTTVQIGSGTKPINDKKFIEDFVQEGQFKYYRVKKPRNQDSLVILTVLEGESDLYAKRGHSVYPDLNSNDFKSVSIKDDEITFPVSGSTLDEEEFTVGVYGASTSRYRIAYFINSAFKVYPVQSGEFIHKFIEKEKSLLLQFDLPFGVDSYLIGFTGEFSQVDGYANFYDENTESFIDSIPDLSKTESGVIILGSNLYPGTISRVKVERSKGSAKAQLLIKIRNPNLGQIVSAYVVPDSPESVVQIKSNEKITDTLNKGTDQTYQFYFENEVQEEVLDIELAQGKIKVLLTDQDDFKKDANPLVIEMEASSYYAKKQVDLYRQKEKNSMGLFKKYLAKVIATKDSMFSLYSTRKGDKFIPVKTGNNYIMKFDPNDPTSFYYHVSSEVRSIAIQFEVKNPEYISESYGSKGEDGKTDDQRKFEKLKEVLDKIDMFYITEENFGMKDAFKNSRVEANIIKSSKIDEPDRYYMTQEVNVMKGYLIISPKQGEQGMFGTYISTFKVSINDVVSIGPNYRTSSSVEKGKSRIFSLLVPERSSIDFTVSICRGGDISVSIYEGHDKNRKVLVHQKTLTNNMEYKNETSTMSHRLDNIGNKKIVLLEVAYVGNGNETASFAINTVQTTFDDKVSLASFFEKSVNFLGLKLSVNHGITFEQTPEDIKFTIDRVVPLENFKDRYPNVKLIKYDYSIMYSNEKPRVFETNNVCDPILYHDRKSFFMIYYSEKAGPNTDFKLLNFANGSFTPNITMTAGYPRTDAPYHGVYQIRMTVLQQDTPEVTTDAMVMFKIPILISYRPRRPIFYYILVLLILLVLGGVAYFLMNAAKTAITETTERNKHDKVSYSSASDADRNTGLELN